MLEVIENPLTNKCISVGKWYIGKAFPFSELPLKIIAIDNGYVTYTYDPETGRGMRRCTTEFELGKNIVPYYGGK